MHRAIEFCSYATLATRDSSTLRSTSPSTAPKHPSLRSPFRPRPNRQRNTTDMPLQSSTHADPRSANATVCERNAAIQKEARQPDLNHAANLEPLILKRRSLSSSLSRQRSMLLRYSTQLPRLAENFSIATDRSAVFTHSDGAGVAHVFVCAVDTSAGVVRDDCGKNSLGDARSVDEAGMELLQIE